MRKWFNVLLALIALSQATNYVLACSKKSSQETNNGWNNISNNKFTKITGVTGQIASIDFTSSTFYAGSTDGKIYRSTNQQTFQAISTSTIPTTQNFSNLIFDNNDYLTIAVKDIINNVGGIYRTNTTATPARYAATPFSKPIMGLFLDKKTNDTYVAMEDSEAEQTILYKFNSNNTTPPVAVTIIEIRGITDLIFNNTGNIYFVINNPNNARSFVYKYDIKAETTELIFTLADTIISTITTNNDIVYLAAENINTNNSIIYQSTDDGTEFVKSNVKTNWIINKIIFDEQNHFYAGGINNKLYAATIDNDNLSNFSIISSETFNNIYSLNYEQGVLIVGGQDEFSLAQVNEFKFTKK